MKEKVSDREGTTKKSCDKDVAELSGELSGAICLNTTRFAHLLGNSALGKWGSYANRVGRI